MSNSYNVPENRATGRASQDEAAGDKSVPESDVTHSKHGSGTSKVTDRRFEQASKDDSTDSGKKDKPGRRGKQQSSNPPKSPRKKSQKDINDLVDFIAYAYSRKGQRLSLKPKDEKAIRERPKLDDESRRKLLDLAKEDVLLAVPRQILLAVRNIVGFSIKREVQDFVRDVLNRHPAFSIPELEGVLNNLGHAPDPKSALAALSETDYSKFPELAKEKPLIPKDYEALRVNAIYSLAVWFSETRELSPERLSRYLFEVLWQPKTLAAKDDTARLQMITDIRDLSGVGIACMSFKQQADQQMRIADSAKRAEETVLKRLRSLESSYEELQRDLEDRDRKIAELHKTLEKEKQTHEHTRMHLSDDLEHLRSRFLRRLKAEVTLLDEGLHALRRDPPKIRVMEDHAERVLDGLKREIKELDSDE